METGAITLLVWPIRWACCRLVTQTLFTRVSGSLGFSEESRHLPQAIVIELLEQLAYLGLRVQAAEKPAKERARNQNCQA